MITRIAQSRFPSARPRLYVGKFADAVADADGELQTTNKHERNKMNTPRGSQTFTEKDFPIDAYSPADLRARDEQIARERAAAHVGQQAPPMDAYLGAQKYPTVEKPVPGSN